ncbi:MAG TPA: hypothetical protein VFU49_15400 [Ktedonobacteraceae bacterium]|nr:hypothetical protein [Ktedonobacteraceae bacterium]
MMVVSKEERSRILRLIEAGRVSALEAEQLLDALEEEQERPLEPVRDRTIRIRASSMSPGPARGHLMAVMPVNLIKVGLRLGTKLIPQLSNNALEGLLQAIERGATGRLLDLQDLERGERLEVFVE